jgi:hypothetical protein
MNLVRAISSEGFGRAKYYREIRDRLDTDPQFPPYFEQESSALPQFYKNIVRQDLGPLMEWLPESALYHDPNAYLKSERSKDCRLETVVDTMSHRVEGPLEPCC